MSYISKIPEVLLLNHRFGWQLRFRNDSSLSDLAESFSRFELYKYFIISFNIFNYFKNYLVEFSLNLIFEKHLQLIIENGSINNDQIMRIFTTQENRYLNRRNINRKLI